MFSQLPRLYDDIALGDLAHLRQQCYDMLIGLAVYRRGGYTQFSFVSHDFRQIVGTGLGLDTQVQNEIIVVKAVPHGGIIALSIKRGARRLDMKWFFLIVVPILALAASREECGEMLERFSVVEAAYDAAIASKVAAPATRKAIDDFRKEGGHIYAVCKDKMSTTRWYMLGKKVKDPKVDVSKYLLESPSDVTRYAISHPPVIIQNLCGTIRQGVHLPAR